MKAVTVPVTADLEGGYGLAGDELVDALLAAGAVGCNIENTDHARADQLLDAELHATYLAAVRAAAAVRGVPIVVNARIDTIIRSAEPDAELVFDETVRRARLYLEAGADCVYPIGLRDPAIVRRLVAAVDGWINVNPSTPLSALAEAGAARVCLVPGRSTGSWVTSSVAPARRWPATPPRSRKRSTSTRYATTTYPQEALVRIRCRYGGCPFV